jgi:hypothetical protein
MNLRTISAARYVTPLREGGALPALVEADDAGLYVLKFRGAGQGRKALVAELVVGELARAAGLQIPEIVLMDLDADLARTEADPEIQDLLRASAGLNLALDYLPGSVTFDPLICHLSDSLASKVVWLDAFAMNVDRSARNTNLLMWHRGLWLIDHGAALYVHHQDQSFVPNAASPFTLVKDHVLVHQASMLRDVDADMHGRLTPKVIDEIVDAVPGDWLAGAAAGEETNERREMYRQFLKARLQQSHVFVEEALRAQAMHV